jgi:hypothetical protein
MKRGRSKKLETRQQNKEEWLTAGFSKKKLQEISAKRKGDLCFPLKVGVGPRR